MVNPKFQAYSLAVSLYRLSQGVSCPSELRSQLLRASSSVALNLAEGSGKLSPAERRRYFGIALGSLREVQAILDLAPAPSPQILGVSDQLGAYVYRLCFPRTR